MKRNRKKVGRPPLIFDVLELGWVIEKLVDNWADKQDLAEHGHFPRFVLAMKTLLRRMYLAELKGQRRPFLTRNLKRYHKVVLRRRYTNFVKWVFVQGIHASGEAGECTVCETIVHDRETGEDHVLVEFALDSPLPAYLDEAPSGFSQSPEEIVIHNEIVRHANQVIDSLASNKKLKNGAKYLTVLTTLRDQKDCDTKKREEISAITTQLDAGRKRTYGLKFHAIKTAQARFPKDYDFKGAEKAAKQRRDLSERFHERSNTALYADHKVLEETVEPYLTRQGLNIVSEETRAQYLANHQKQFAQASQRGYLYCYKPGICPSVCPCDEGKKLLEEAGIEKLSPMEILGHPELYEREIPRKTRAAMVRGKKVDLKRGPKHLGWPSR